MMARMSLTGRWAGGARHRLKAGLDNDRAVYLSGVVLARLAEEFPPKSLEAAEFRVFSQWGEDGILDHLVTRCVPIAERTFVEIGVQDYRECNTRFLAMHRDWSGLAVDGGTKHQDFVARSELDWRQGVRPVTAFVTAESVADHLPAGDLGLLSLDVDGMDYWILEAALAATSPRIVVVEYNALFGPGTAVTVPYRADFSWTDDPAWGTVYFGASLGALDHLMQRHGYRFVGCESHGVNSFFVRDDVAGDLGTTVQAGFRHSRAPVARRIDGSVDAFASQAEKVARVAAQPLVEVSTGRSTTVSEAVG